MKTMGISSHSLRTLGILVCFSVLMHGRVAARSQEASSVNQTWVTVVDSVRRAIVTIQTDRGLGTGFLVRSDGTLITSNHVVAGASGISIKLDSGETYNRAFLLVTDEQRDIAILRIEGAELSDLRLANSDQVKPGEDVLLIGAPRGLEQTVSAGIVSGLRLLEKGTRVIQTTTPASPGSSGGPLLNRDGEVVGVMTFSVVEGQNLNFAVPSNYVRGLLNALPLTSAVTPERLISSSQSLFSVLADPKERVITPRVIDSRGLLIVAHHGTYGDDQLFKQLIEEMANYLASAGVRLFGDPVEVDKPVQSLDAFRNNARAPRVLYVVVRDFGTSTAIRIECLDEGDHRDTRGINLDPYGAQPVTAEMRVEGSAKMIRDLMRIGGLPKVLRDQLVLWRNVCLSDR